MDSSTKLVIFEDIEWYEDKLIKDFYDYSNPSDRILETFKRIDTLPFINLDLNFSDSIWDFSKILDLPINNTHLKFNFKDLNAYTDISKFFVLSNILKKNTKIRVLSGKLRVIKSFLFYVNKKGYIKLESIPKHIYIEYFNKMEVKYNTKIGYKRKILEFIKFYEINFQTIYDTTIKNYLDYMDLRKLKLIKETSKRPQIPEDYLNRLVQFCMEIMKNPSVHIDDRCTAALIILYSQIGFRTGELLTIKANSIVYDYSPSNQKPLRYLSFLSYKNSIEENGAITAHTIINDLSFEAYKVLMDLCLPYRKKLKIDNLFVARFQKNKNFSPQSISVRFRKFLLKYNKQLDCINTQDKYPELSTCTLDKLFKVGSDGYSNLKRTKKCFSKLKNDDILVYPNIHSFRVTVCTTLYRQKVPMYYIQKHMNHLSHEMASYYIRPEKDLEKKYSEIVYSKLIKEKSKLLGQHADDLTNKINSFIKTLNINIEDNIEEVIKRVANKYPLRKKTGGICIRCGDIIPCASNTSSDDIFCAFNMCPNHCHMFFMADISYEKYLDHKKIIKYNKENGFLRASEKETNKLIYVIENSLLPELDELEKEINKKTSKEIKRQYSQLSYIVDNFNNIYEEVKSWKKMKS